MRDVREVRDVREATLDDIDLLAGIAAAGFYDDPVMRWACPDPDARLAQLNTAFQGLTRDYLPDRGTVHVIEDACVAFWRAPSFEHGAGPEESSGDSSSGEESEPGPFPPDVAERFGILESAMAASHPHEPHWYLNVISTLPERQGRGLGARAIQRVLAECDAEGIPAYLESSNPRNITLYERHGFRRTGEIPLPDGPSLYPMWRDPQPRT